MKQIYSKDISQLKEFVRYGEPFHQVRHNPETGWWLYERGENSYEVVKGKKHINPDGQVVYTYPPEADWGTYGYTIIKCWWAEQMIDFLMSAPKRSPEEIYEFKKGLKLPNAV